MWNSERFLKSLLQYRGYEESESSWVDSDLYKYKVELVTKTGHPCTVIELEEGFIVYHGTENKEPTPRNLQRDRKISYSDKKEFTRLGYEGNSSLFVSNKSTVDQYYGGTEIAIVWKDRVLCKCPHKNTFSLRLRRKVNLMDLSNKENLDYIITSVCNPEVIEDKEKRKVLHSLLPEAFPIVGNKVGRFSDYSKDYLIMRLLCNLIPECDGFYFSPKLTDEEAKKRACFAHHEEICMCDIKLFEIIPNQTNTLSKVIENNLQYPHDSKLPVILDAFPQEKTFTLPQNTFLLKSIGNYAGIARGFKNLLFSMTELGALPDMKLLKFDNKYLRTTKLADNVISKTNNELKIKRLYKNHLKQHLKHETFEHAYDDKHNYNLFELNDVNTTELARTFRLTVDDISELKKENFQGVVGPMYIDSLEELRDVLYVFDDTNLTTHSLASLPYIDTFLDAFPIYTATLKYVKLYHDSEDNLANSNIEAKNISCVAALTIEEELAGKSERGVFNVIQNFDHEMVDFS